MESVSERSFLSTWFANRIRGGVQATPNRLALVATLLLVSAAGFARGDTGYLRIDLFPQISVADSRSTVTVSVDVRLANGRAAPDGTRVLFQTTMGRFQEANVSTSNGVARALLTTGSVPGAAKITVNAISLGAAATAELELVANRSELASSRTYVEMEAPTAVRYSMDYQTVTASGSGQSVTVRIGKSLIQAADVQFDVSRQEIRAHQAHLVYKGKAFDFSDLLVRPTTRQFIGTTSYVGPTLVGIRSSGHTLAPWVKDQAHFGVVQVLPSGTLRPLDAGAPREKFEFQDISDTQSEITAKRALVFPNREIQFQKAAVAVNGQKVIQLPLYRLSLAGGPSSFGEQILTLNDNKIGVDYPYYLSMSPNQTSLLRLQFGQPSGRTLSGNSGSFVNYEMKWNREDGSEGGLTLSGLNRQDWSLDAHHSFHYEDGSSLTAMLSSPQRKSIFGSIGFSKPIAGYHLNVNASSSRTLTGLRSDADQLSTVLESDPRKQPGLPLTWYYGLTATESRSRFVDLNRNAEVLGLRLRGQFDPLRLSPRTSLNSSFALSQRWGTVRGLGVDANVGLTQTMPWGPVNLNYDYLSDSGLASALAGGRQRLSLESAYTVGRTDLHLLASRSLDADVTSFYGDASYQFSGLYRFSLGYTLDTYFGDRSLDYTLMFSYRLGLRELGLLWSNRTKRLGLEVLGARF